MRRKLVAGNWKIDGGSVKPGNAAAIFAIPNVGGALVGGASIEAAEFGAVISTMAGSSRGGR